MLISVKFIILQSDLDILIETIVIASYSSIYKLALGIEEYYKIFSF